VTMSATAPSPMPAAAEDGPVILTRGLTREYRLEGEVVRALNGIDLDIHRNEFVAIMGPSGSGKSTLMNMIGCLDTPTSGEYWLNGQRVSDMGDKQLARIRNKEIGFVFQTFNLLPRASSLHNVELPLIYAATPGKERRRRAQQALERVGLGERMNHRPSELSGGQRQRVAIARALTVDPRLIVADEAVSMVDVSIRISLLNLLLGLRSEMGVSIVLITHDLAVARYFARSGRIGVMYLGRMVELARSEALVADPAHPYSAALIAAIPEADPRITRSKERIELRTAEVPSLLNLPPGCTFHPRCPLAEPGLCDVKVPQLLPLPDETPREVACHVAIRERTPAAELIH